MLTLFKRSTSAQPAPTDDPLAIRDLLEHPELRRAMGLEPLESDHRFVARLAAPDPTTRVLSPIRGGMRPDRQRQLESAA